MRHFKTLTLALALATAAQPVAADGAISAEACTTCHGRAGESPGAMPSLTGRSAEHLAEALTAYRDGALEGTIMPRLAAPLSDEDIEALAETIAAWQ